MLWLSTGKSRSSKSQIKIATSNYALTQRVKRRRRQKSLRSMMTTMEKKFSTKNGISMNIFYTEGQIGALWVTVCTGVKILPFRKWKMMTTINTILCTMTTASGNTAR